MPRGLLEAVLRTPLGPVRMMTTHLEWSSSVLRGRQVEAIRQIHELSCSHVARPSKPGKGTYALQLGTRSAILTGDSNMLPSEAESLMKQPFASDTPSLVDAWESLNPGIAHPPSMSVHDPSDGAPRCLDYVLVTSELVPRLRSVDYDQTSQSSDHQPVVVELI